jgi:small subunit ribosomal protein S2
MPVVTRRELLEAGVHFGHQTRRWNPKMRRFIFGERSGIYIIDLEQSLVGIEEAYGFLLDIGRRGGSVLFVGTKKQAQEVVASQAARVGMPYVNTRWLGGMLTNFQTIYRRLQRLKALREMERSGMFEFLPKKEVIKLRHEKEKLDRNLAGLQDMERLPDAVYVIDTKKEHIAVTEARKLGIPVVAIVDTNADPDEVDYPIPGNDDAIRACTLITKIVADALQEGQYLAYQQLQTRSEPEFEEEPVTDLEPVPAAEPDDLRPKVQLSAEEAAFLGASVDDAASAASAEVAASAATEEGVTEGAGARTGGPSDLVTAASTEAPVPTDVPDADAVPTDARDDDAPPTDGGVPVADDAVETAST